jgi:hypothetical protein
VLGLLVAAISNLYHRLLAAVLKFFFASHGPLLAAQYVLSSLRPREELALAFGIAAWPVIYVSNSFRMNCKYFTYP